MMRNKQPLASGPLDGWRPKMKTFAKVGSYLALGALYAAPLAGLDKTVCVAGAVGCYTLLAALTY